MSEVPGAGALLARHLGRLDYLPVWQAMQAFTAGRETDSRDEVWLLEHPPVFTQGHAGKAEHVLLAGDIPVMEVDRGGQVTYHGPGQRVVYLLLDLRRLGIGVRVLVERIEQALIETLASYGVAAGTRQGAPGVYVDGAKIAALGLKVRRGCCYHGLSLNVDMDLQPFGRINPCGYSGLQVTQLRDLLGEAPDLRQLDQSLLRALSQQLRYTAVSETTAEWTGDAANQPTTATGSRSG